MLLHAKNLARNYFATTGEKLLSGADWQGLWRLAYCRPGPEKPLAREPRQRGVPYFLPWIEQVTDSAGPRRRRVTLLPPAYLFMIGGKIHSASLGHRLAVYEFRERRRPFHRIFVDRYDLTQPFNRGTMTLNGDPLSRSFKHRAAVSGGGEQGPIPATSSAETDPALPTR